MATSGTIKGTTQYNGASKDGLYSFWAEWKRNSYSVENNTSNITISLKIQRIDGTNYGAYNLDKYPTVTLKVNGAAKTPTTSVIDTRNKVICTFATWTGNVTHNNDGSLSCPIVASFTHSGSTTLGSGSVSGNASLDTIPRASSVSLSASSVNVGGSITATITRASSNFTHTVEFYVNNTYYKKYTSVATSQAFTIPDTWHNAMPSSTQCTAYCRITTYNGSAEIGSQDIKSFTVKTTSKPSAGSIEVDPENINGQNVLIKGKNKIKITVTNAAAGTGSTISSYKFEVLSNSTVIDTYTYNTTSTSATASLGPFNKSGNLTFKVTVTNARKQSESVSYIYKECYDYADPYFSAFDAYRANSDGSKNVNGTYLKCTYTPKYSSVGSTNSVTVTVHYGSKTSSSTLINLEDSDTTYQVYLEIKDKYDGSNKSSVITVFGQSRILNITSDGTGFAIGKMAEKTQSFESRWPAKFDDDCEIVGNLTVGDSTQDTTPTTGISVHDVRNATITPNSFGDNNVNFYFDQIDSRWMGIFHMKGWSGNYAAWELAGNAHNSSSDNTLKYRQGLGDTWSDWQTVITNKNINNYIDMSAYLPLSAGVALSGRLGLQGNAYYTSGSYGLNCNNSDIINANGIYFGDASDSAGEAICFYRSDGYWDSLYAQNGVLKFHPNRSTSAGLGGYTIYNSSNFRRGTCTLNSAGETTITFSSALGGTPTVILTPLTTVTGVIAGKVKSASSTGFTATIGGSSIGDAKFAYLAIYF